MTLLTLASFGILIIAAPNRIAAQKPLSTLTAENRGVRHVLYLAVKIAASDLRLPQQISAKDIRATLNVTIRISDHSQETNFAGDVPVAVPYFDPIKGSHEQKVWQDAECHRERGFPKMTVISIGGSITNDRQKFPIDARMRKIGLPLPEDEVIAAGRLAFGTDGGGSFFESHTETKKSGILAELKMYILPCDLQHSATR